MRKWLLAIVFGSFVGVGLGVSLGLMSLMAGGNNSLLDRVQTWTAESAPSWWPWRGDAGCSGERLVRLDSTLQPNNNGLWLEYSIQNNCSQPVWVQLNVHGGESNGHKWRNAAFTEPISVGPNSNSGKGEVAVYYTSGSMQRSPAVPVPSMDKVFVVAESALKPKEPLKCSSVEKVRHDLYWDTSDTPEGTRLLAEGRMTNTCDQAVWSFLEVVAIGSNGVAIGSGFSDGYLIKPSASTRVTVPVALLQSAGRSIPTYTMRVFTHVKP